MSDAFYRDMANTALGVINDFQQGVLALERRSSVAGAEPWDPDVPTTQTLPVVGVVQSVDRRLVDGTSILATDRLAILPANALPANVVPQISDRLIVDGEPTTIKKVLRVPEAGIVIVYRLILGS
jgi:hypothetical protein